MLKQVMQSPSLGENSSAVHKLRATAKVAIFFYCRSWIKKHAYAKIYYCNLILVYPQFKLALCYPVIILSIIWCLFYKASFHIFCHERSEWLYRKTAATDYKGTGFIFKLGSILISATGYHNSPMIPWDQIRRLLFWNKREKQDSCVSRAC